MSAAAQHEVEAQVLSYNKRWVWLRIPRPSDVLSHIILTMPRAFLPRGMATAEFVVLRYQTNSLHHDGHAWVVKGKIVRKA